VEAEHRLRANGPELLASELAVVRARRGEAAAQRGQDMESIEEGRITGGFSEGDSLVDSVREAQRREPDPGEEWETVEIVADRFQAMSPKQVEQAAS
jgi:hypothetical protein